MYSRLLSCWRSSSVSNGKSAHSGATRRFAVSVVALAAFTDTASAQEAAPPAPAPAIALPQVNVTTETAKQKKAKAKGAPKQATPVAVQVAPSDGTGSSGGATAQGGTKPGLNLDVPSETGSRLNMTPLETPASVEIIPGETIKERGQTSVNQAVTQNATGFTSTASPGNGGTGLAVRGFAGHGSVMQLYDGTRLYVGSGTVTFPFDTWSAERIEVLRGPASVLYGEGAIGGVINVVPKKPTDYFTGEGEIAIGTDGLQRFGVGAGGPLNDQVSYRLDASGIKSDGWLDQEGEYSSLALSGAVSYRPTKELKLTLSHDFGDQSPLRYFGAPLINGAIPEPIRFTNFNVADSDIRYLDNWSQFETEWNPTNWFSLRNTAYRLTSHRHWKDVEAYAYQPATGLVRRSDYIEIYHDQEQIGDRLDATFRAALGGGVKNEIVVGFDVNRIDFRHTNDSPYSGVTFIDPYNFVPGFFRDPNPPPTVPSFSSVTNQYALFAEDRLELSKQLAIVGGIRLDRPSLERRPLPTGVGFEKDFSDVTWRAGAVYTPIDNLAFYGQYATGVDPIGGLITLSQANAQYELATGRQYEIGVKQSVLGGLGEWTLAAYDIEKKNLLSRDPNNSQIVRQVGAQSSRGIEASVAFQVTDTLRYEGNAAVLQARYDEFRDASASYAGKRPPNVPEQVVNNWLSWAFLRQWEAHVGVQWVGSMYVNDANTINRPAFTVVNLGLDYDVTERSEISLRIFNVFDEVYATGGGTTKWQLAPPRSGELAYRIKY